MSQNFVEKLMDNIMEATMIPKVQVERVVGPILSMFLADVLTATFQDDPDLSGEIRMISPEFPLKKEGNKQSTNIDWLMFNTSRKQLLLVELKTSDTSINVSQNAIYLAIQQTIQNKGGYFLIEDFEKLRDASQESGKYQYILDHKVSPYRNEISICRSSRVIYLVPQCVAQKIRNYADKVLTFGTLSDTISGSFAEEWQIIHQHLCKLDHASQQSRNIKIRGKQNYSNKANATPSRKWQGTLKFDGMVKLCLERGNEIVIGFTGGKEKFSRSNLGKLQNRSHYKWDYKKNLAGKKRSDWLSGASVVEMLKRYHNLRSIED